MSWKVAPIGRGGDLLYSQAGTPSLDLRFAEKKALTDYVSGDNLVTFSRNSNATYVDSDGLIKTATTNTPRFGHDPTTGESLGLLVEEARTNVLPYSEALDSWQLPTTESSNTTVSPGGNTAYGLDSASSASMSVSNPAAITFSVFAKPGTSDFIYLRTVNWGTLHRVWFNLSAGTVGSISPPSGNIKNVGISKLSNGWYRVFFTLDSTGDSVGNLQITSTDADLNTNTVGYVFAWGAQVEEGAFPTSYIPTNGTPGGITRTADAVQITGTNFSSWYNQSEGTVFTQCTVANIDTPYSLQFDDTSNNNIIALINNSNNVLVITNSISQYSSSFPVPPRGATKSIATALAGNNTSTAVDGTLYGIDTSVTLPSVTQFRKTGATVGHISRLTYWPQRLPDTTLQTITT